MKNICMYALFISSFVSYTHAMEPSEQSPQTVHQKTDPVETPEALLVQLKQLDQERIKLLDKLGGLNVSMPQPETSTSAKKMRLPTAIEISERKCSIFASALYAVSKNTWDVTIYKQAVDAYRELVYGLVEVADESSEGDVHQ
jgi:hypothetical protein